jgi:hypothetical protein
MAMVLPATVPVRRPRTNFRLPFTRAKQKQPFGDVHTEIVMSWALHPRSGGTVHGGVPAHGPPLLVL